MDCYNVNNNEFGIRFTSQMYKVWTSKDWSW